MWTVFAVRILFVCSWAEENEPKSLQSQLSVVQSDSHDTTMTIMERDVSELHCLFQVVYVRILTRLFLSLFSLLVVKKFIYTNLSTVNDISFSTCNFVNFMWLD